MKSKNRSSQTLTRDIPAWLASLVIHVLILLLLAAITWIVVPPRGTEAMIELGPADLAGELLEASGSFGQDSAVNQQRSDMATVLGAPQSQFSKLANLANPAPTLPLAPADDRSAQDRDPATALLATLVDAGSDVPTSASTGAGMHAGASSGFQALVKDMQRRGLDVVLVFDATGSMEPYIEQTKQRLRQIIGVITGVIDVDGRLPPARQPRFGVVAYKDFGDDYGLSATRYVPLTRDIEQVGQFIDSIMAGGGGDTPEPVHMALKVATSDKTMNWRRGRKAVIVLIGDSPTHTTGRSAAVRFARQFAVRYNGSINVIDVGGIGNSSDARNSVLGDMRNIAEAGRGSAFLLKDSQAFWRHLIVSVFGQQYQQDVEQIVQMYAERNSE